MMPDQLDQPISPQQRLLMTSSEVARAMNVPEETVRNLHRLGTMRGVMVGKHLRWKPKDIRQFIEKLEGGNGDG